MEKGIITVVGEDQVGIIAKVCTYLAENKLNILDISQTIIQGYFNMMMIIELQNSSKDFGLICDELENLGKEIGVNIKLQHENIFNKMHRIKRRRRMINLFEVTETNKMIEQENLDVRTITIGISLLDCMDHDIDVLCQNIYKKITSVAKDLVKTGEEIERKYGIPIVNKRISITPIGFVGANA